MSDNVTLLIDGKNFAFRSGVVEDLTNRQGEPVYLIYVGMKMLRRLVYDYKPKRIIFLWDGGRSKWRMKLYPEYKDRGKTSFLGDRYKEIISQIDIFRNTVLPMLPVTQWLRKGCEADDLINAAVKSLYIQGEESVIISTDKDFYQLLPYANIYRPAKEDVYTEKHFKEEYKFSPTGWVTYRAMTGDSSDNIKGVDGIGAIKAKKIMIEHGGSIEDFYNNNPNGKIEKKAHGQIDIFDRNLNLMNFDLYPDKDALQKKFEKIFKKPSPTLSNDDLKEYFLKNNFISMLKSYRVWIKPFEKMWRAKS